MADIAEGDRTAFYRNEDGTVTAVRVGRNERGEAVMRSPNGDVVLGEDGLASFHGTAAEAKAAAPSPTPAAEKGGDRAPEGELSLEAMLPGMVVHVVTEDGGVMRVRLDADERGRVGIRTKDGRVVALEPEDMGRVFMSAEEAEASAAAAVAVPPTPAEPEAVPAGAETRGVARKESGEIDVLNSDNGAVLTELSGLMGADAAGEWLAGQARASREAAEAARTEAGKHDPNPAEWARKRAAADAAEAEAAKWGEVLAEHERRSAGPARFREAAGSERASEADSPERVAETEGRETAASVVGRSLTEGEAADMVASMEAKAELAQEVALTPENWLAQFGEDGVVVTPIGEVKMGGNQLIKLVARGREKYYGMIHPTLANPDLIIEKAAPAEGAERDSKYLFVKTFVKSDGSRVVHFESVTVRKEGLEVSISSHEATARDIKKDMQNGKILHVSDRLSLGSERSLTETPQTMGGPDLVPTPDSVAISGKGSALPSEKQGGGTESSPDWTREAPSEGRARGSRNVNGHVVERRREMPVLSTGKATEVKFSATEPGVEGEWAVVRTDDVVASHDAMGNRNPEHFLDEAQPKERDGADSTLAMTRIAQSVDPNLVLDGTTAYQGAPVVNERGEVIQGNNRARGLKEMTAESRAKYNAALKARAEALGIDPAAVDGDVMLVRRVRTGDAESIRLGQFPSSAMESGEKGAIDPGRVLEKMNADRQPTDGTVAERVMTKLFEGVDDDATVLDAVKVNGREVIQLLADAGYLTETEVANAVSRAGELTKEGRELLTALPERLVLDGASPAAKAAWDSGAVPEQSKKAVIQALAHDMRLPEGERLRPIVQEALEVLGDHNGAEGYIRRNRKGNDGFAKTLQHVRKATSQTDIFGTERPSAEAEMVAALMVSRMDPASGSRGAKAVRTALTRVMELARPEEAGALFGGDKEVLPIGRAIAEGLQVKEVRRPPVKEFYRSRETGRRADERNADDAEVYDATKGLVESSGVEVIEVGNAEAREALDGRDDAQLMGSKTNRKMAVVGEHFAGKALDSNQQAVVDVYSGKADNVPIVVERPDGKVRVVMRQGNEQKAGTKHSILRHYEAKSNFITAEDIALIPEVIAKGKRTVDGNKIAYDYVAEDNTRFRATTEKRGKDESFTNFFTNRKTSKVESSSVANNAVGTRHRSGAQSLNQEVSGAKIGNKSESGKSDVTRKVLRTKDGTVYGWTVGGKVYLNRDAMNPEAPLHEYTHLWDAMTRKRNPKLWERGKELMRQTSLWDEVVNDPNYADIRGDEDAIASEVHSRLTGKRGAERLRGLIAEGRRSGGIEGEVRAASMVARLQAWLREMYAGMRQTLSEWSGRDLSRLTAERFADLTLRDLAEGMNPNRYVDAEGKTRFSIREEEAPKKTRKVYKLMRLGADGKLYPLFIDSAAPAELGVWYDADSPNLSILRGREPGQYLVDQRTGEAMTRAEFNARHPELATTTKYPSKEAIYYATAEGLRWMEIEATARGQKRFGGENRKYWNLGINGSGSVSRFSMRPGWHAGSLPTMRQIGKGKGRDLRDDSFVWVEGEVSADVDYNAEAQRNPDKDLPDRIPADGFYMKATNADKKKSQADQVGWYVAGAFKANRIISDREAREVIDRFNAEHPEMKPVEYDYARESGREFVPGRGLVGRGERIDGPLQRAAMSRGASEFDATRERAIAERGIVMPGLRDAEVKVVEVPRHDFWGTGKEALKAAKLWAKDNIVGIHRSFDSQGREFYYSISNGAVEKYMSRSATSKSENIGVHLSALKMLPDIIAESIEAEVHADYKKSGGIRNASGEVNQESLVHRFYGAVKIGGEYYRVKTTMREYQDENRTPKAHSYEITQIELLKAPSDGVVTNSGERVAMTSNNSISVAKLLHGVEKSYDPGKKLLEESDGVAFRRVGETSDAVQGREVTEARVAEVREQSGVDIELDSSIEGKGEFDPRTGKVRIDPDRVEDAADLERTIAHEMTGHGGALALLGERFDSVCRQASRLIPAEMRERLKAAYPEAGEAELGAEWIARLAENPQSRPSAWRRVVGMVRLMLARRGFVSVTEADIRYMLYRAGRMEARGEMGRRIARGMEARNAAVDARLRSEALASVPESNVIEREGELSFAQRAEAIRLLSPIPVEPNSLSRAELRNAYKSLKDVVRDGMKIRFLRTAFGKNYKEGGLFSQVVPYLHEILKQSVHAYSERDNLGGKERPDGTKHKTHPNIEQYDNYVGKARIDGEDYYVRLTVQRSNDSTGMHSCFVSGVELYKETAQTGTDTTIFDRPNQGQRGVVDAKLQQFFEQASSGVGNLRRVAGFDMAPGEVGRLRRIPLADELERDIMALRTANVELRDARDSRKETEAAERAAKAAAGAGTKARLAEVTRELNRGMRMQKDYDAATADSVKGVIREMMKERLIEEANHSEVARLLSALSRSVGSEDMEATVNRLMDIVTSNQTRVARRDLASAVDKCAKARVSNGVRRQGDVDMDFEDGGEFFWGEIWFIS